MGVLAYTVASAAQGDLGLVLTAGRGLGGVLGGVENWRIPGGEEAGLAAGLLLSWKVPST